MPTSTAPSPKRAMAARVARCTWDEAARHAIRLMETAAEANAQDAGVHDAHAPGTAALSLSALLPVHPLPAGAAC
jgi:hypothetical protein